MPKTLDELDAERVALQATVTSLQAQLESLKNRYESAIATLKVVASVVAVLSVAFIGVELVRIPKLIEETAKTEAKLAADKLTTAEVVARQEKLKSLVSKADASLENLQAQIEVAEKGMTGYSMQAGPEVAQEIAYAEEGQKFKGLQRKCATNQFVSGILVPTTQSGSVGGLTVFCKQLTFERTR